MTKVKYPAPYTDPLQYASGYSLDLYCDHHNDEGHEFQEFPHQFTGETFAECARAARRRGWVIHRKKRTATCPTCIARFNARALKHHIPI